MAPRAFDSSLISIAERVRRELRTLDGAIDPRVVFLHATASLLPDYSLAITRAALLRAAGLRIGARTAVQGRIHLVGRPRDPSRIVIGDDCILAPGIRLGVDAPIRIGDRVALGPDVTLCTATHVLGFGSRRMSLPTAAGAITIRDGAWICMQALILPGVTIGAGAVVGAQSVVVEDVDPHTLVAGNPAVMKERLPFAQR